MINLATIKIGDKVHYQPEYYKDNDKYENGIVKSVGDNAIDSVFVVYNCGGEWNNYQNYTAALTNVRDLYTGWKH
jgi:hypothetical protein